MKKKIVDYLNEKKSKLNFFVQQNKKFSIFFTILFVFTCIPRFYDILKFLPDYSIDENDIVEFAVFFFKGTFEPFWYKYGALYWYILSFIYKLYALITFTGIEQYAKDVFFNSVSHYYIARFVNSLIYVIIAYISFKIASKYFNATVGKLALVIAIIPISDLLSNFTVRIDTLLALWSALCIYQLFLVAQNGKMKNYILAGLFFGLGIASKPIPSLLIGPTIYLAHYLYVSRTSNKGYNFLTIFLKSLFDKNIYILFLVGVFSNFLYNPYLFLRYQNFKMQNVEAIKTEGSRDFISGLDPVIFYSIIGYAICFFGAASLLYLLVRMFMLKKYEYLIVISYPIVFWTAFSLGAARGYFYVPMMFCVYIAIAFAIMDISNFIKNKKISNIVMIVLLCAVVCEPVYSNVVSSIKKNKVLDYKQNNSELVSTVWIEENIPVNENILMLGDYTALPRLVSSEIADYGNMYGTTSRTQGNYLGQFFYYGRGSKQYFVELFQTAHTEYINDKKNKVYTNLDYIRVMGKADRNTYFGYITNFTPNYLVSNYHFPEVDFYQKKLIKSFDSENYGSGSPVYVYNLSMKSLSDTIANPQSMESFYFNALINHQYSQIDKAKYYYTKVIEKNNKMLDAYYNRANINLQIGLLEQAKVDFLFLNQNGVQNAQINYNLGYIYFRLNDLVNAKLFLEAAKNQNHVEAANLLRIIGV